MAGSPRAAIADRPSARHPSHLPSPDATLQDFLDSRSPGFDLLRLILAMLVLVSHTWPLGGFGPEPGSPLAPRYLTLGGFAVAGFFAMSGMLVGRSALRRSTGEYARARILRIVPGYWVAVMFSGFVVAWLGWLHERGAVSGFISTDPAGPLGYVGRAALFPIEFVHGVYDIFVSSTPFGQQTSSSFVNGSLWTLPYEMRCYLVVGLLAIVARRFGNRTTITAAWFLVAALAIVRSERPALADAVLDPYVDRLLIMLTLVFLSGSLVAVWAPKIRLFGLLPLLALVVGLLAGHRSLALSEHVGGAALALILPPIAAVLAPLGALLRGVDLSYGMYLYAWPVQMLVAMYSLASGPWVFIAISTVITALLAAGSWFLVEKPAMVRWKSPRPGSTQSTAGT